MFRSSAAKTRWRRAGLGTGLGLVLAFASAPAADDAGLADARRLFLTGRYEEAADAYRPQSPVDATASLGLAGCLRAVGKGDEATACLQAARVKHPQHADLAAELARLAFERGDLKAAQELAAEAVRLDANQRTARWITAEIDRTSGRLDEANRGYQWFIDDYNERDRLTPDDLRWVGLAAAQYARWNRDSSQFRFLVNRLYPAALRLDKNYWPARLEMGLLFLEKYNAADAQAQFQAALAINPNAAEVHAAQARLALQDFDLTAARAAIERALAIHPQLPDAHRAQADVLLAELRVEEAITVLERTRELNPVDEETLGRLAAAYGVSDGLGRTGPGSRLGKLIAEVTQRNPHCGGFFEAMAECLDRMRRYPDAATYFREAQRRMPQLLYVQGQLGMILMRLGEEPEARRLLEASFRDDPFHVRVRNTLEVLDVLQDYAVIETEHFVIKCDRRDEVLGQYAARHMEEVFPHITGELGFSPPQKSLIEMFSRARNTSGHGWFSARMVGLPFVGTVGACAGRMVAIASPNDLPEKYNWTRVLRHEFVHIVTLQQTNFNIPHWFTEGLAVRYEGVERPAEWNEVLVRRAKAGTLLNLDTINGSFLRPKEPGEWALAYCQAELYVDFMVQQYGAEALRRLLAAYVEHPGTATAIRKAFGVEQPEFEQAYRRHVEQVVAGLRGIAADKPRTMAELEQAIADHPDDAEAWAELAREHLRQRSAADARRCAMSARKLRANHALAGYVLARLSLLSGDKDQAVELLRPSLDEQSPQPDVLALLAGLELERGDVAEAERLYLLGDARYPADEKWLKSLCRVYLESGDELKLRPSLGRLADRETDNLLVRKKLLALAIAADLPDDAVRWGTEALHIDVLDAEVHRSLADVYRRRQQFPDAIRELETAVRLWPDDPDVQVRLAETRLEAGQRDAALDTVKKTLEQYPAHEPAQQLLKRLNEPTQ